MTDIQTGHSLEMSRSGRKANPDGTVTVRCRICGEAIMKMMFRGFTTAICSKCQGLDVPAKTEELAQSVLYTDSPEMEKVGLARAVFRALGFGRPKEKKAAAKQSKSVSKEKRRKPLFGPEDEE